MRYEGYNRGTVTGKTYRYADCFIWWDGFYWCALEPSREADNGHLAIIARAPGIKPMRNKLYSMKINKEGPWDVQ